MQEIIQESKAQPKKARNTGIPIKAFFNACARNWYWFVISAIIFSSLAYLYSKSKTQLYQATALIVVNNEDSKTAGTTSQVFSDLNLAQGNGIVSNELYKIRSSNIMENVVRHLGLNIQYYGHVYLRDVNIYKHSPVQITPLKSDPGAFTIEIVPKSMTEFEFKVNDEKQWKKARFGSKINTKTHGAVAVTKTRYFTPQHKGYLVKAKVMPVSAAARGFVGRLTAEQADKYSDIVRMSITTDNYDLCLDILNALIEAYNEDALSDKNKVAHATEEFINQRIAKISGELGSVDSRIASLKSASANAEMYADASSGVRFQENVADANMQLSLATYIRDYLAGMSGNELIPTNTGISSTTGIEQQINQYNEVMLKYQKISATATPETPIIADLNKQLAAMRGNIMRSANNYIKTLSIQRNTASSQAGLATGSRVSLPGHEKAITEVTRKQNVQEQLYIYLLNKLEETQLQLAISESNAKVIENAHGSSQPISPIPSRIILIGLLLGLLLPAAILYAIYWMLSLDTKVHSRRDIEDRCDVPIIGELPAKRENQKDTEIVVTADGRDRVTEAFRIVRSNLDFVTGSNNSESKETGTIIQLTSTMSGEGKSFIALNLSLTYAHVDKRVVVVDLDLRKGRFSEYAGINNNIGVSAFLSNKVNNVDDILVKGKIDKNLDFVPIGAIPPNPTALLMSGRLNVLLQELASRYDYVLLDTVPFGLIADASLINRHVDLTVYIIRDGKVDKRILDDLQKMSDDNKVKNLTFLVNDIKVDKKNYGYGAYGYGYGYEYNYNYEYDKDGKNRKRWWQFWKK